MPKETKERKPHLLRVKQEIVALIDEKIRAKKRELILAEDFLDPGAYDLEERRNIAIWVKERNRLAKAADLNPMPLTTKSNTGTLIYSEGMK